MNRTPPVAFSRTTFLPVAGNSPVTVTGTWTVVAGMTPASGSTVVAAGSAVTENAIGPIVSIRGVTVMSAVGQDRDGGHRAGAEEQQQDDADGDRAAADAAAAARPLRIAAAGDDRLRPRPRPSRCPVRRSRPRRAR